ncbi:MAG: AMP-binding protein [Cyclobacteriaceae bacterium]
MLTINGKTTSYIELASSKINEKYDSDFEKRVIEVIKKWNNGDKEFAFESSGSTGEKNKIQLSRDIMEYSAKCTLEKLDPKNNFKSSLIAINPNYIGGTMAIIRALIGKHNIEFIEPKSNPLAKTSEQTYDLVSMVPLQIQSILDADPRLFEKVKNVIIGGADLQKKYIDQIKQIERTDFYHSYGMTETASHIALKNLKYETVFETLGDVVIKSDKNSCLSISGTITNNILVKTTDIVEIIDESRFKWIGRADNVINTGGVKVFPEEVESKLANQIPFPFFVAGLPDERLGERVVLIIESDKNQLLDDLNFEEVSKYAIPKSTINLSSFVYTETSKINRSLTLKKILGED